MNFRGILLNVIIKHEHRVKDDTEAWFIFLFLDYERRTDVYN